MRYAIFSDIHGNLEALRTVLADAEAAAAEAFVCLGDIVGYGPRPSECLSLVREVCGAIVAGNHEFAVTNKLNTQTFNASAKLAVEWTRAHLSEDELRFLAELPLTARGPGMHIVHGTLLAPELFDYIQSSYEASLSLAGMEDPLCWIGHSHVPVIFCEENGHVVYRTGSRYTVSQGRKAIINVGSVGQPRDRDPRASYALYDDGDRQVELRRIPYDVEQVVAQFQDSGLPLSLGERLRVGR